MPPWWPPLTEHAQVRRRVRAAQRRAVDRGHQQSPPPHPAGGQSGGRAAQQVEQGTQRADPQPAAGLRQRAGGRRGYRQAVQPGDQLTPHARPADLGVQHPGGQQEIDHHPRGQVPHPLLDLPGLRQHGVDHLERHDPGQFTQMTGSEPAPATVMTRVMTDSVVSGAPLPFQHRHAQQLNP